MFCLLKIFSLWSILVVVIKKRMTVRLAKSWKCWHVDYECMANEIVKNDKHHIQLIFFFLLFLHCLLYTETAKMIVFCSRKPKTTAKEITLGRKSCVNLNLPGNKIQYRTSSIKVSDKSNLWLLWSQCRRGPHRLLHCDWCHAGTYQAREDRGHLRTCNADARPAQLHGANRRPVRLHTRRAPGGRQLWHNRSARQKPVRLHPETDPDRGWRECHWHGAGVQGTNQNTSKKVSSQFCSISVFTTRYCIFLFALAFLCIQIEWGFWFPLWFNLLILQHIINLYLSSLLC